MPASTSGPLGRAPRDRASQAWRMAPIAATGALAGCAESGLGGWTFATLALLLTAAGAFATATLLERRRAERALRAARGSARVGQSLLPGWAWQTDAGHRVVAWHGPGTAAVADCPLNADPQAAQALQSRLRQEQPFVGHRLTLRDAVDGSRAWLLQGTPRHDDLGRFEGFDGRATAVDADDARQAAAAALASLLAASDVPVLVAVDQGRGARLIAFSEAARQRWPGLRLDMPLLDATPDLPKAVREACARPGAAGVRAVQGWKLAGFDTPDGAGSGVVLTQATAVADTGAARETENFTFTVSHDLRAPIRVVEGFTRIVKEDYGVLLDRVGNDHLDRVLGAATRMNLMIDAMLTLARLSQQPLARQPVSLSQLAGYVADDLRRTAPEREVDVEIEDGLQTVGDPTLLRLVLENLIGNAWKYTARCSRAQISLRAVAHGAGTAFVVRDNGAGFDMRSADRLFGLFQRLHSASEFPGHGVGLASVRRIVQRHGGELWAEGEPGRGAAFFFTLAG